MCEVLSVLELDRRVDPDLRDVAVERGDDVAVALLQDQARRTCACA